MMLKLIAALLLTCMVGALAAAEEPKPKTYADCVIDLTACTGPLDGHMAENEGVRKHREGCVADFKACKIKVPIKVSAFSAGATDPLNVRILEKCLDKNLNLYAYKVCMDVAREAMKSCDPNFEKTKKAAPKAKDMGFDS